MQSCTCPQHVLLFCPLFQRGREAMIHAAGTEDYSTMLQTPQGVKACVRWAIGQRILQQFHFAQEMVQEEEQGLQRAPLQLHG
jgi:hypothetical protein